MRRGVRMTGLAVLAAATVVLACASLALPATPARAGVRPGLEAHLGAAWNPPVPLTVRQDGQPDLSFTARYETRPFVPPMYYVYRLMLLDEGGTGWTLDLVHHKLRLRAAPSEIAEFSVSHGYNLLLLSRRHEARRWHWALGAGAVVAHPEGTVRGRKLDETRGLFRDGFYVSGAAVGAYVGRRLPLGAGVHATAEARATLAWARVPVADGDADAPDAALHVALGLGWLAPGAAAGRAR